jgi:DivIVA domain-containing protein
MDRPTIQRSDFPTVRRGYEPDAVDAHLRRVADELESLRGSRPVAAQASAQVGRILEAAESTAEQLRTEAGDEAREHVHRVSTASRELLERIGAMHDELGALMDRMREDAGRLSAELRSLERDVVEIGPPPEEEPMAEAPESVVEPEPQPEPEPEPETAPETAAAKSRAKGGRPRASAKAAQPKEADADRPDDVEAARLVALDMALGGAPREETEKYLAEHYSLADPGAVLDDVYALAGS